MRGDTGDCMRRTCSPVLAGVLLVIAMHEPARSEERADSSVVHRWSVVYRSRIDIDRTPLDSPWNGEEASSPYNDRLAILGELSFEPGVSVFGKGATGFRLGGDYQEEQFILEQGHVGFNFLKGAVRGRLFSRERVYRTDEKLLTLLSDESGFVAGRGEGLALEMNAGGRIALSYIESIMKDDFADHGGLPTLYGYGDIVRMFRLEGVGRARWHAGFTLLEVRSEGYGDRVTVGTDFGLRAGGIDLLAELARTQSGGWEDLREHALFDLRPREARLDRLDALFSDNDAFAAEIEGLKIEMGNLGDAGLVPAYRFAGTAFTNPEGEIAEGLSESRALAWWKPAPYDALISIDASDGVYRGRDFSRLIGNIRMRYKGGFELRESILCASGERISAAVTLIDDNDLSRIVVTARIDDLGAGDVLSYLAQGTLNLGSRVAAKSALYLYQSRTSLYNVEIEFRPREKFLFQASIGSFTPQYEGLMLDRAFEREIYPPSKNRFILFFARVWFGGEGAK